MVKLVKSTTSPLKIGEFGWKASKKLGNWHFALASVKIAWKLALCPWKCQNSLESVKSGELNEMCLPNRQTHK